MEKMNALKYGIVGIIITVLVSSIGFLGKIFGIFSLALSTVAIIAPILAIVYGRKELEKNPAGWVSSVGIILGFSGILIQIGGTLLTLKNIFSL